jgi:hypothetical protein
MLTKAEHLAELARIYGVEEGAINVVEDSQALQFLSGMIQVNVSIGGWEMQTNLTKDDLGVTFRGEVEEKYLMLGQKYLLPKRYVLRRNSLESSGRYNLAKVAVNHKIFGSCVTPGGFKEFMVKHKELETAFLALYQEIYDNWDSLMEEVEADYREVAIEAWRTRRRQSATATPPESIITAFWDRVKARIPNKEKVLGSAYYDAIPFLIPAIQLLGGSIGTFQDSVAAQAQLEAEIEVREHWVTTRKRSVETFLDDTVGKIRGMVYDAVSNAKNIAKGGKLKTLTLNSLNETIRVVRAIDPYGDYELEAMLSGLEKQIKYKKGDNVDAAAVIEQLNDLETVLRSSLILAGAANRMIRKDVATVEVPAPEEVRGARDRLGLTNVTVPPVVQTVYRGAKNRTI